jgi:hypothetical protein
MRLIYQIDISSSTSFLEGAVGKAASDLKSGQKLPFNPNLWRNKLNLTLLFKK